MRLDSHYVFNFAVFLRPKDLSQASSKAPKTRRDLLVKSIKSPQSVKSSKAPKTRRDLSVKSSKSPKSM
jgi:hypothetical protein